MSGWRRFRVAGLILSFLSGIVNATLSHHFGRDEPAVFPFPLLIGFYGFGIFAMPFMLAAVISFQATNPLSDQYWTPPSHDDNPFRIGNPLRFFHFVGFQVPAIGLGVATSAIWTQLDALLTGVFMMLGGVSTLAGVHLAMRICKHKIKPGQEAT